MGATLADVSWVRPSLRGARREASKTRLPRMLQTAPLLGSASFRLAMFARPSGVRPLLCWGRLASKTRTLLLSARSDSCPAIALGSALPQAVYTLSMTFSFRGLTLTQCGLAAQDARTCCLCRGIGDGGETGRLLPMDDGLWIHTHCGLWSSEVWCGRKMSSGVCLCLSPVCPGRRYCSGVGPACRCAESRPRHVSFRVPSVSSGSCVDCAVGFVGSCF